MTNLLHIKDNPVVPWSADRAEVLALFTQPGFSFRCQQPDTLAEHEISALLGTETHVLCADGRIVGLYAVELVSSENGCHYQLHLRLTEDAPDEWWLAVYPEIVRALHRRTEIVRLMQIFAEFDERGLRIARALRLAEEGTLAGVLVKDGRRYGNVYFAQTWTVQA
jgi:hypothetical protein